MDIDHNGRKLAILTLSAIVENAFWNDNIQEQAIFAFR